jgi:hypothetical protein
MKLKDIQSLINQHIGGEDYIDNISQADRNNIIQELKNNKNWHLIDNISSSNNEWYFFQKKNTNTTISINDGKDDIYDIICFFVG